MFMALSSLPGYEKTNCVEPCPRTFTLPQRVNLCSTIAPLLIKTAPSKI